MCYELTIYRTTQGQITKIRFNGGQTNLKSITTKRVDMYETHYREMTKEKFEEIKNSVSEGLKIIFEKFLK